MGGMLKGKSETFFFAYSAIMNSASVCHVKFVLVTDVQPVKCRALNAAEVIITNHA